MVLGYEEVVFSQRITDRKPRSKSHVRAIENISWFHGEMQRTSAEILLMSDGILEGTFLLRRSLRYEGYAVSVRCEGSVKHFKLCYDNRTESYVFGNASFPTLRGLLAHFESCPILSKDNDVPVTLINPLNVGLNNEPEDYMDPVSHIEGGSHLFARQQVTPHIGSKSGYLYKRGNIRTNWKRRWFTVDRKTLKYFENRRSVKAIRSLDISMATEVGECPIDNKKYSFQLVFPSRTFYFFATSDAEARDWVDFFQWKLDFYQR